MLSLACVIVERSHVLSFRAAGKGISRQLYRLLDLQEAVYRYWKSYWSCYFRVQKISWFLLRCTKSNYHNVFCEVCMRTSIWKGRYLCKVKTCWNKINDIWVIISLTIQKWEVKTLPPPPPPTPHTHTYTPNRCLLIVFYLAMILWKLLLLFVLIPRVINICISHFSHLFQEIVKRAYVLQLIACKFEIQEK